MNDKFLKQLKEKYDFVWNLKAWSGPNATGKLLWEMNIHNIVVNEGLQKSIDDTLLGGTQSTTWYMGVTDSSPTVAAADTMASHAGWTEITDYDESVRQTWTGVRSGQNVTNTASPAVINITTGSTIGGAFLTDNNTKGGTTGTLFSVVAATQGNQTIGAGGSLSMVYSITAADDGA